METITPININLHKKDKTATLESKQVLPVIHMFMFSQVKQRVRLEGEELERYMEEEKKKEKHNIDGTTRKWVTGISLSLSLL